jgi:DNA polymerase-4
MTLLNSPNNIPRLRWLVADLNSYFASCEQQENPELRGKPVAVAPLLSDTTCAIAASYAAKVYGVKTGTNIGEAKKILPRPNRCPVTPQTLRRVSPPYS